ncbi:MAG: hypothetical protein ACOVOV_15505, partial [Dolichospermum sp.]
YATDSLFGELIGITIDEVTKDIYVVSNNSSIFKIVIDTSGNTITTKLTNIPDARGIAFLNGIIYCSTSGNIIYQIILGKNVGQLVSVLEWISSPLIGDTYSIIVGPNEDNANTFYVSTNTSGIVKILKSTTQTINITSSISVDSVFNKTIGNIPFNLNAASNNPSTITYSSSNTGIANVDNNGLVTIVGNGTCKILMNQNAFVDGNLNYSACSAESGININLPVISVAPVFNKILTDSQFNLNANSNSQLPITYQSNNPNVATVDSFGNVTIAKNVTIANVGNTTITISQYYQGMLVRSTTTIVNVYANPPFGNVTAMSYDANNNLLYVCSSNDYPYNFITISNDGTTSSLNIPTTNANIQCMNVLPGPYEPT